MVGAAGFEPTITGSKPDALPLGYAPTYVLSREAPFKPDHFELQRLIPLKNILSLRIINKSPPLLTSPDLFVYIYNVSKNFNFWS